MLLSFVFAVIVQGQEYTWRFTPDEATCGYGATGSDCNGDWQWISVLDTESFTIAAGETKTFAVDYNGLEGTNSQGGSVTLSDDRSSTLYVRDYSTSNVANIELGGEFADCNSDASCHSTSTSSQSKSQTKCDFEKNSVKEFTVRNKGSSPITVSLEIDIDGNDEWCGLLEDVVKWVTTVLIIIGVCCGIGIIAIICCMCGGVACCCAAANNNKGSTTTTTQTTQMATGPPMPSQPAYGGAPGGSGRDLTQWSTGLQPGWEAKFDESAGKPYWVNHSSQTSTWDDPRGP